MNARARASEQASCREACPTLKHEDPSVCTQSAGLAVCCTLSDCRDVKPEKQRACVVERGWNESKGRRARTAQTR